MTAPGDLWPDTRTGIDRTCPRSRPRARTSEPSRGRSICASGTARRGFAQPFETGRSGGFELVAAGPGDPGAVRTRLSAEWGMGGAWPVWESPGEAAGAGRGGCVWHTQFAWRPVWARVGAGLLGVGAGCGANGRGRSGVVVGCLVPVVTGACEAGVLGCGRVARLGRSIGIVVGRLVVAVSRCGGGRRCRGGPACGAGVIFGVGSARGGGGGVDFCCAVAP